MYRSMSLLHKVGGHQQATLDAAAGIAAGTAIFGKRSHASHRGATYAELVQPVHGAMEWAVFRRLPKDCVTRKGTDWHKLGDLWDDEMERNPALTAKSSTVLSAAQKQLSNYLALKHSVHAMQDAEPAATAGPTSSSATPAAATVTAAAAAAGAGSGAGRVVMTPGMLGGSMGCATSQTALLGALIGGGQAQVMGQLVRTAQGQQLLVPQSMLTPQLGRGVMLQPQIAAGQVVLASLITPQMAAAAAGLGLTAVPRGDGTSVWVLQQQRNQLQQQWQQQQQK
jgi:hypothetical protein